jgi:hypothetical protein
VKRSAKILTLGFLLPLASQFTRANESSSANYAISTSIDGGGQQVESDFYTLNVIITPISGRTAATFSDVMFVGFGSRFNTPPIAVEDVLSHPIDTPVNITTSSLLANDFDPDGDSLSLIAMDATSAAGGSLTISGQNITYTPPQGLAGFDQFQYTVADSNGDTSSATVIMAIAAPVSDQPLKTVSITQQSDGKFLVRFRAQTGSAEYIIQFSNDLNNPNWQILEDVHAGADGIVQVLVDANAAENTFFRAVVF